MHEMYIDRKIVVVFPDRKHSDGVVNHNVSANPNQRVEVAVQPIALVLCHPVLYRIYYYLLAVVLATRNEVHEIRLVETQEFFAYYGEFIERQVDSRDRFVLGHLGR